MTSLPENLIACPHCDLLQTDSSAAPAREGALPPLRQSGRCEQTGISRTHPGLDRCRGDCLHRRQRHAFNGALGGRAQFQDHDHRRRPADVGAGGDDHGPAGGVLRGRGAGCPDRVHAGASARRAAVPGAVLGRRCFCVGPSSTSPGPWWK